MVSSECRIVPFTKPPCSVVLLGELGLTKACGGAWQACRSAPAQRPGLLCEEACGFLLVPVSRGDGPPHSSPPRRCRSVASWPLGLLGEFHPAHSGPDGAGKHSPLLQHRPHSLPPSSSQFCPKHLKNASARTTLEVFYYYLFNSHYIVMRKVSLYSLTMRKLKFNL